MLPEFKLLKGQKSNVKRKWEETFFDPLMVEHFENDLRKEAGPIVTRRFVREKTGQMTTRDDNQKAEYLFVPDISKRRCYYKEFCLQAVSRSSSSIGQ
jgi:hypothetical protein